MTSRSLIGTELDQIPVNAMLGGLAYQSPENATIKNLDLRHISEINAEVASTAVDVFVYDTSKDSDGGAWRYRTQHTSWYNETLNTATRGSRQEFPAVAVIVAESTQLTIYDGDDPDMPMWMVFNLLGAVGSNSNMIPRGGSGSESDITSIACLNGRLAVGLKDVSGSVGEGLAVIDFISELARIHRGSASGYTGAIYGVPISGRNSNNVYSGDYDSLAVVAETINDVSMTVLPNAQIDPFTGLPIPTIAVATDGGVSVIKDDGSVVSSAGDAAGLVEYLDNNYLIITRNNSSGYFAVHNNHFTSAVWNGNANSYYSGTIPVFNQSGYINGIAASENGYFGNSNGVHIYDALSSSSTNANGLFSNITTSYNTGWMHGDIKGAFLSDTTVESLTANTNLASSATQTATARLTSETYTNGATSWQMVDNAGNDNGYLQITFGGLTTGQSYHLSMTVDANAALDAGYQHKIEQGSSIVYLNHWNGTGAATLTTTFEAVSGQNNLIFYANGITVNVTNFNIRAVDDEDRSVNNKGLQVFGTITKSAVATGADLVGYSGWSASNNLIQPYNSGLNFGTGDFSIMAWIKKPTLTTNHYILDRNDGSTENDRFSFMVNASGAMNLYSGTNNDQCNSGNSTFVGSSAWRMVMVKRISGVVTFGLDGKEYASTTTSGNWSAANLTGSGDENLFIGQYGGGAPGSVAYNADYGIGEIALLRISASVPSPEQIKKIYDDEKILFQDNAACTLYGSSDAVTALAYDDSTSLLHVGTSSGRSDFTGLKRINHDTSAVSTAISAQDGLISQQ